MGDERSIGYLYYLNSSITSKKPCMRKHPCKAFFDFGSVKNSNLILPLSLRAVLYSITS